jgi:hypothetical protein
MSVYQKIAAISAALARNGVAKSHFNKDQKFHFRSIDDIYNALAPLLVEEKLLILPRALSRTASQHQTKNGGTLFYVVVEVEYDIVSAEDGTMHTIKSFGEAMDSSDKATGKAMSSAYKSAVLQAFCIPTASQDADAESPEVETISGAAGPAESPGEPSRATSAARSFSGRALDELIAATRQKAAACGSESGLNILWIKTIAGLDTGTQQKLAHIFKDRKKALLQSVTA